MHHLTNFEIPTPDLQELHENAERSETVLSGVRALANETYLPKFPSEDANQYDFRRKFATMTNVYADVLGSIAQKPFSAQVRFESSPADVERYQDDITGSGQSLHEFAASVFYAGLGNALDFIIVDQPPLPEGVRTRAQQQSAGIRPKMQRIDVSRVIEARVHGVDSLDYFKFYINDDLIRVYEFSEAGPVFIDYERPQDDKRPEAVWPIVASGPVGVDVIPIVWFSSGQFSGSNWKMKPPFADALDLQIDSFHRESGLKHAEMMTCFPMLAAQGIRAEIDSKGRPTPITVSPNRVLYAPPDPDGNGTPGRWEILEPSATSLAHLANQIERIHNRIRELGKQPLTAQSGGITRIQAAYASSKSNSSAQNWALGLKLALERATRIFAQYLGSDATAARVVIDTAFEDVLGDEKRAGYLLDMFRVKAISHKTLLTELRDAGTLSRDLDVDAEIEQIALEFDNDLTGMTV